MCQYVSSASEMKYILVLVLFAVAASATETSNVGIDAPLQPPTSHETCETCVTWPQVPPFMENENENNFDKDNEHKWNKVNQDFFPRHGLPPAIPPKTKNYQPKCRFITQKVDNFQPLNPQTWQMRYIESDEYYKPGGPIFIMLGAEWTIDDGWLLNSQMVDMAEIHGAYMYYTEHRYYGHSHPTYDLSTENLKYLTTSQALADVAHFIAEKKLNPHFNNSKVVVFGGSYGGTMATWMRQKYPNLVHAAVASSAPLLAKVDFSEYHEVVRKVLGDDCASVLMNGSAEIRRLIATGQSEKVEKDFNLCYSIRNEYAIQTLFLYLSTNISGTIQYANPDTVPNLCSKLQDPSLSSDYDRCVSYFRDNNVCRGNYEFINSFLSRFVSNDRQWFYQTCTEYGFYQTSWTNESLYNFGISLDFMTLLCRNHFGSLLTNEFIEYKIKRTNQKYGALKPEVTRVVSVHGAADPWHALGLPQDDNPSSPTYVVDGASHCKDMYSLDVYVNEAMRDAKLKVVAWIDKWLKEP